MRPRTAGETILDEGARVMRHWLVGVTWQLRRNCECPRCWRLLMELLADTARLQAPPAATPQEVRPS